MPNSLSSRFGASVQPVAFSRIGWGNRVMAFAAIALTMVFCAAQTHATAQDAGGSPPAAPAQAAPAPAAPAANAVVELVIDYGDGVEKRFPQLAHRPGITVFEVLQLAARHPRGVRFEHRGQGETAFVMQIDDLRNEGRGRNWTYRVNGKRADRGAGVFPVAPGDKVVWTFGG
jgi:hypothetical protein